MAKIFFVAATLIATVITTRAIAQDCGGPVPVLSIYTTLDPKSSFSIGTEFGSLRDDSPWGYFGGVIFSLKKDQALKQEKELAKTLESIYPYDLTIYMKGSFRLVQKEWTSIHAVTSAEMDMKSRFDLKTGFRLLLPVGDQVALTAEPLFSARNKNVTGRVGFSIAF